jgi:hypothetical protein
MVSRRTIAAFMGAAGRWTAIWRESLLMALARPDLLQGNAGFLPMPKSMRPPHLAVFLFASIILQRVCPLLALSVISLRRKTCRLLG